MCTPPWKLCDQRRLRVVMLGNDRRPSVASEARRLRPHIEKYADVVLSDFCGEHTQWPVKADFAVVFGGDGSILRAANQMGADQLPVLGVNLGRLGFLAALLPEAFLELFPRVCRGDCRLVDHLMLQCEVLRGEQVEHSRLGLNETAIHSGPPFAMLDIDLYVDSVLATTYSCDGLIISTPVGSTAHNLSAGGPILRKSLEAFVISPISPHTLTVRPVVDRADRVYEVFVRSGHEASSVVVDGSVVCTLDSQQTVRVRRAVPKFQMIEVGQQNYYRTLRDKLGWRGQLRQ